MNVLTTTLRIPTLSVEYLPRLPMTAQAPILLFGSYGELDVYASVVDAERAIDPWTLSDGQLSAADASGRVLRVLPVGRGICLTDTGAIDPDTVRAKLSKRLREEGDLGRLIERAVERFGYRR